MSRDDILGIDLPILTAGDLTVLDLELDQRPVALFAQDGQGRKALTWPYEDVHAYA